MKVSLPILLFSMFFLFVGCGEGEAAGIGSATAVSQVIVPTETAVPPTTTTEPKTAVTETAVSLPTTTPTPAPILPPPPDWVLYFLWDSVNTPSGLGDPIQALFKAVPGVTPDDWQIEIVLENLVGQPQSVMSLDKSTLAITPLEDLNGDGYVSYEGYARGGDGLNIFVYSFLNGSYQRVTEDFPRSLVTVLEDNKILVRYYARDFRIIDLADLSVKQLTPPIADNDIHWIKPSPDRSVIAVNLHSAQLQLIDTQSGEIKYVSRDIGGFPVESTWSPDGQWLAVAQPAIGHFFLVEAATAEAIQIPDFDSLHYPTWSPDGERLFLVREIPNGSELLFFDMKNQTFDSVASLSATVGEPLWSPDGKHIAFTTRSEGGTGLELLNLTDSSLEELWFFPGVRRFQIFSWSPDSQWLIFHAGQAPLNIVEDESGLFLYHQNSGSIFQILDSSGKYDPYGFIWQKE